MTGFQREVNLYQAPGVEGDFASANPRSSVLSEEAGLVCGEGGVNVAKFAWLQSDGRTVLSHGTAPAAPDGFVHRNQQGLISTYLAESGMNVPVGFPITLHNEGDFWAKNTGPSTSVKNDAIYARYSDGAVFVGATPTDGVVTASIGSTNTAVLGSTFTATGSGTTLTVTSVTGLISIGDEIDGTGVTAGTTIVDQISGTPGGAGDYETSEATTSSGDTVTSFGVTFEVTVTAGLISIGDTVSGGAGFPVGATVATQVSGTAGGVGVYTMSDPGTAYTASASGVTTFGTKLKVTAVTSGTINPGNPITGSSVPANAIVTAQDSGTTGGVGVYTISVADTAYLASTTVTAVGGVLTAWKAKTVGAVGELIKISTWG